MHTYSYSFILSRQLLVLTCREIAIATTHMLAVVLSAVPFKFWILSACIIQMEGQKVTRCLQQSSSYAMQLTLTEMAIKRQQMKRILHGNTQSDQDSICFNCSSINIHPVLD